MIEDGSEVRDKCFHHLESNQNDKGTAWDMQFCTLTYVYIFLHLCHQMRLRWSACALSYTLLDVSVIVAKYMTNSVEALVGLLDQRLLHKLVKESPVAMLSLYRVNGWSCCQPLESGRLGTID